MRVHEMQGTPRMPWFWPNPKDVSASVYDEHQRAFQAALDMRTLSRETVSKAAGAGGTVGDGENADYVYVAFVDGASPPPASRLAKCHPPWLKLIRLPGLGWRP